MPPRQNFNTTDRPLASPADGAQPLLCISSSLSARTGSSPPTQRHARGRWTAAGILEAERQFRRIIGYADLAKLITAIERELDQPATPSPTKEAVTLTTARPSHTGTAVTKFYDERDILRAVAGRLKWASAEGRLRRSLIASPSRRGRRRLAMALLHVERRRASEHSSSAPSGGWRH